MKVILPVTLTDAMVAFTGGANSAPAEPDGVTDPSAWVIGTTYAAGALVHRTTTHRKYRSLAASNTGNTPETTKGVWWEEVGGTMRWAMFDPLASSKTSKTSPLTVTLTPGIVNSLAALGLVGSTLTITQRDGVTVVYSQTIALVDGTPVADWWGYFFDPIAQRESVVLTDLLPIAASTIEVSLTGTGTVAIGTLMVGTVRDLGVTLQGAEISGVDYSRKEFDAALGVTLLSEGAFRGRLSLKTIVPAGAVDAMVQLLKRIRATPVVWIGADDGRYQSMTLLAFPTRWSKVLEFADRAYLNIEVEEMT
jgi:hypothetical protein